MQKGDIIIQALINSSRVSWSAFSIINLGQLHKENTMKQNIGFIELLLRIFFSLDDVIERKTTTIKFHEHELKPTSKH